MAHTGEMAQGASLAVGTANFAPDITSFTYSGLSRDDIDMSHLGLSANSAMEFEPSDLYDPGELTLELNFDPNAAVRVPWVGATETVTITFADSETFAGSAYVKAFEFTGETNNKLTATCTVKFAAAITYSA